ncbi:MAG: hypothetical protein WC373_13680 [Smithella sp.]|jgi:hypothetical protein
MNRTELEQAVYEEWHNMHHNASIRRFPDFQNEYEEHLFWETLNEDVSLWCEDLQAWIEEKYGERLTFYSFGRSGATIAPAEYMLPAGGNLFGGLSLTVDEGLDGYNQLKHALAMFREINRYWADAAANIPEWWKDMKEGNDWQTLIDEHDGKILRTVQVWK